MSHAHAVAVATLVASPKALSCAVLETIAIEQHGAVMAAGEDRLSYFIKHAQNTDTTTFNTAIKDFRKAHKDDKTFTVRCSEFQALFYGLMHKAEYNEMGYQAAVSHARKYLDEKGLRTNGLPKLSEEEKEANRTKNLHARIRNEVNKTFNWSQEGAGAKFEDAFKVALANDEEAKAQTALEAKIKGIDSIVKGIMDEGVEYAVEVMKRLQAALDTSADSAE